MKTLLAFLLMVDIAYAGQVGDMNADGAVGLPEAIIALQCASGIPATSICSPAVWPDSHEAHPGDSASAW